MHIVMEKALNTVRQHNLLRSGDTVFVALSGGADSMTLLSVLLTLKDTIGLSGVAAMHLHHGLRGKEADRDAEFVTDVCERLHIPLFMRRVNVAEEAKRMHESCEEAGRRIRYAFFSEVIADTPHAKIATAHTADDQAETVLLRILRGSGISGLAGIPYTRDEIVRPLLDCTREEIEAYCREYGISFVNDSTNSDLAYDRNNVRHRLLPLMQEINPQIKRSLCRLSLVASEEELFWIPVVGEHLENARYRNGLSVSYLSSLPIALRKRLLLTAARKAGASDTAFYHIDQLEKNLSGGSVNLPQKITAISDGDLLQFLPSVKPEPPTDNTEPYYFQIDKPFLFGGATYCAHRLSAKEYQKLQNVHKNLFYSCFSCDMISGRVFIRARKDGDCFSPARRHCTKTLKKLLNEQKIPANTRSTIPIVCDDEGILLVWGISVDERAAVFRQSADVIWIENV